eukprot:1299680-Prymnesium_polylepis.1
MRDHQTSKARALVPNAHAHHARLAILSAPDASVTLRISHASMRMREAVLRTYTDAVSVSRNFK